jgi:hypothetical protein
MMLTPERKAQIELEMDAIFQRYGWKPRPLPKPKVVTSEGEVVRDVEVTVSPADTRNMANSQNGTVIVKRPDYVAINFAAYEAQQAERARERAQRRALDPDRLGLYGHLDED